MSWLWFFIGFVMGMLVISCLRRPDCGSEPWADMLRDVMHGLGRDEMYDLEIMLSRNVAHEDDGGEPPAPETLPDADIMSQNWRGN